MPLTHRMSGTYTYFAWKRMRRRCLDEKSPDYKDYGGKGITICERWMWYPNFFKDMGERPTLAVLDRKNNKLGYCKSNCRWATFEESARNRSHLKKYTINGKTKWLWEWVKDSPLPTNRIYSRLHRGWPIKEAVMLPLGARLK